MREARVECRPIQIQRNLTAACLFAAVLDFGAATDVGQTGGEHHNTSATAVQGSL